MNTKNLEITIGIVAFISVTGAIYFFTKGFVFILLLMLIFASIAIYLFSKKNIFSKILGVITYEGIILKVLMPSKYRKQINEIDDNKKT